MGAENADNIVITENFGENNVRIELICNGEIYVATIVISGKQNITLNEELKRYENNTEHLDG